MLSTRKRGLKSQRGASVTGYKQYSSKPKREKGRTALHTGSHTLTHPIRHAYTLARRIQVRRSKKTNAKRADHDNRLGGEAVEAWTNSQAAHARRRATRLSLPPPTLCRQSLPAAHPPTRPAHCLRATPPAIRARPLVIAGACRQWQPRRPPKRWRVAPLAGQATAVVPTKHCRRPPQRRRPRRH